jgi:hypothetical protein
MGVNAHVLRRPPVHGALPRQGWSLNWRLLCADALAGGRQRPLIPSYCIMTYATTTNASNSRC